ncbi:hypothetical protein H8S90_15875 [Olivibacter sp. SDN3]|uniref:hypothetical protein n=1 Tax=Olivibacter sp. SDN3 TaxID=2764720 RepID=UPI00165188D8|nr:hypothetical protein [Olivibacter sp. SDN3]QNL48272.1 hypothetical protein H8S90_15875 [Olivibacter sp. SDN3]
MKIKLLGNTGLKITELFKDLDHLSSETLGFPYDFIDIGLSQYVNGNYANDLRAEAAYRLNN